MGSSKPDLDRTRDARKFVSFVRQRLANPLWPGLESKFLILRARISTGGEIDNHSHKAISSSYPANHVKQLKPSTAPSRHSFPFTALLHYLAHTVY